MKELELRIPNIKDIEIINKLAVQVHDLHVNWAPDLFVKCDNMMPAERLKELIENKHIFVGKVDNKIIGFVTFNIKEKLNINGMVDRKQLNIDTICIDENIRGKGLGSEMLRQIKEYAKIEGCTHMYLTVNEENVGAIHTYKKAGFKLKNIAMIEKI